MSSEDFAIIIDGRPLRYYPLAREGFHGGTETMVKQITRGLAAKGHTVHVIANDLQHEEQRGPTEWWWPAGYHPTHADIVMAPASLETVGDLTAPLLVLMPNGIDPPLFGRESQIDGVACFSQCHIDLMAKVSPIPKEKCFITGLGVDLNEYHDFEIDTANTRAFSGPRMLFANDPARGLLPMLDIFDRIREQMPDASLHISYDFDRQFAQHQWSARCMGEILWECKRRIETTDGVTSLGGLTHAEIVREQLESKIHVYPSDPPNTGSQIHGMTQLECAAAGVPLVLSDIEAFPEIFGECARLLPVIGSLRGRTEEGEPARVDAADWADVAVEIMQDETKWREMSEASTALAAKHTWGQVVDNVDAMLTALAGRLVAA